MWVLLSSLNHFFLELQLLPHQFLLLRFLCFSLIILTSKYFLNLLDLQFSIIRALLFSVHTNYIVISSSLIAISTIYVSVIPTCISPAQTSRLNHRVIYPAPWIPYISISNLLSPTQLFIPTPTSPHQLTSSPGLFLRINGSSNHPLAQTQNLEIILESPLSFIPHIQSLNKPIWFYLQNVPHI